MALQPSMADERFMAWAAGFLEGEGSFTVNKGSSLLVSATQADPEMLERLRCGLGGKITRLRPVGMPGHPRGLCQWYLSGARAADLMRRLAPMMSARRREQIARALGGAIPAREPWDGQLALEAAS